MSSPMKFDEKSIQNYADRRSEYEKKYHVLIPRATTIDSYLSGHLYVIPWHESFWKPPAVKQDNGQKITVYQPTSAKLIEIGQAAGMTFFGKETQNTIQQNNTLVYFEIVIRYRIFDFSGKHIEGVATVKYDYEADKRKYGSNKYSLDNRNRNATQIMETLAKARCVRQHFSGLLKQFYTEGDLHKPFLVPRIENNEELIFDEFPELKKHKMAQRLGLAANLFTSPQEHNMLLEQKETEHKQLNAAPNDIPPDYEEATPHDTPAADEDEDLPFSDDPNPAPEPDYSKADLEIMDSEERQIVADAIMAEINYTAQRGSTITGYPVEKQVSGVLKLQEMRKEFYNAIKKEKAKR